MIEYQQGDLLVIIPSRGRPEKVWQTIRQGLELSEAHTHYWLCLDNDDPQLEAYSSWPPPPMSMPRMRAMIGPRQNLVQWTNMIALKMAPFFPFLASFGDDHMPETQGWDRQLLNTIYHFSGPGMAYPNDARRADIPEAIVMSSDIITTLGWMMEPSLTHFHVDDVWADLGRGANCLQYVPEVMIRHHHYAVDPSVFHDRTYTEAESRVGDDQAAYRLWRQTRMAQDIQKLRTLRGE